MDPQRKTRPAARIATRGIFNDVGGVKRHVARSGRRSRLSLAKSRRRRPCCMCRAASVSTHMMLEIFSAYVAVLPTKHLFGHTRP